MSISSRARSARVIALLSGIALLAGCGGGGASSSDPDTSGGGGGATVDVTLTEFEVTMSSTDLPTGEVTFNVTNEGTVDHEFVVFNTDLAEDTLPEASDAP